jgi:hypothetical protein
MRSVPALRSIAGSLPAGDLSVRRALGAVCLGVLLYAPAAADVFVLASEGEVRGQLVNRDESPRRTYVIRTTSGGTVTLDASQVVEVKPQSDAEMKYDRYRVDCPDTTKGHWIMAEWCRKNHLPTQRETHLKRIVELDSNHADARRGLGYSQIDGRWVTQEQVMLENGYVRSKYAPGKWVLPQEEELLAKRETNTRAQLAWNGKLKRYSSWLSGDKAGEAITAIKAIDDPYAVPALSKYLLSEQRRNVRMLYLEALKKINNPAAMEALVGVSINDADDEIRLAALDAVVSADYRPAVGRYVQALKSKNNVVINRAGIALGEMGDRTAIGPLIDALVTTHTFTVQKGQPGQMATTFGTGANSGAFNFGGGGPEIVKRQFENRAVLQALVDLTEGVSFNYDIKAWKYWFVAQRKPKTLDARRDGT